VNLSNKAFPIYHSFLIPEYTLYPPYITNSLLNEFKLFHSSLPCINNPVDSNTKIKSPKLFIDFVSHSNLFSEVNLHILFSKADLKYVSFKSSINSSGTINCEEAEKCETYLL
jgi:hypothetical protein